MNKFEIHQTNESYWSTKGNEFIGTTALPLYGAFMSEEKHQLLGDVSGKKVLEIGCGTGHSLRYVGERGASELWGIDISQEQIIKAEQHLESHNLSANLICSPMEDDCGLPTDYFDIVYSVYAIGWTTDLDGTFRRIASYLKKGGVFIFSWSHPIHKCVAMKHGTLIFDECYFDESWYSTELGGGEFSLCNRKMSTYINSLANAGFTIDCLLEESDDEMLKSHDSDFATKAAMLPVTFVIKGVRGRAAF